MINLKQKKFNEIFDDTCIFTSNEPRLACVLLLDTSSSMTGDPINNLNKVISNFKEQSAMDEFVQKRVDITVIEFNSTVHVVQDFIPLSEFQPMIFMPSGRNTAMNEGIKLAIDKIKDRNKFYNDMEIPHYIPYIFMIKNGKSNDDTSATKQRIIDEEIKFRIIEVPEYNLTQLKSLKEHYDILEEIEFSIFDWFDENNNEIYGIDIISVPNEQHLACVLLLDTSSSMTGDPINNLNIAINDLKEKTTIDEFSQKRVDIAVIEFNSTARVVQDFVPLSEFQPINLKTRNDSDITVMGAGINLAIDKVKERNKFYHSMGTPCFRPWIFMITDGAATDDLSIARQRIIDEENKKRLKFWAIGVPGFNVTELKSLTERCIALDKAEFSGIFNWLNESMMIIISVSNNFSNGTIIPSDW